MYLFLILLLLGFAFVGVSAFTAAYSRWWGERGGETARWILRNVLGIPIWVFGAILAWLQPSPSLFVSSWAILTLGGLLVLVGSIPFIWGHIVLGRPTHMPSVRDKLMHESLYAYGRHPIYSGGMVMCVGLALLKPTSTFALACGTGFVWLLIQARLEEIDLVQRLPEYRQYMNEVPRFIPRLAGKRP